MQDLSLNESGAKLNFSSINEKIIENLKIVFAFVSEHCASFGTKDPSWPLLSRGGWSLTRVEGQVVIRGVSLTRNNLI